MGQRDYVCGPLHLSAVRMGWSTRPSPRRWCSATMTSSWWSRGRPGWRNPRSRSGWGTRADQALARPLAAPLELRCPRDPGRHHACTLLPLAPVAHGGFPGRKRSNVVSQVVGSGFPRRSKRMEHPWKPPFHLTDFGSFQRRQAPGMQQEPEGSYSHGDHWSDRLSPPRRGDAVRGVHHAYATRPSPFQNTLWRRATSANATP